MDRVGNGGRLVVVFVFVAVVLGGCDGSANGVVTRYNGPLHLRVVQGWKFG